MRPFHAAHFVALLTLIFSASCGVKAPPLAPLERAPAPKPSPAATP